MTDISILLPTRGRTTALETSVMSLLEQCSDPSRIEILLSFDDDDTASSQWFLDNLAPKIQSAGGRYTSWVSPRLGYIRLNEYVNFLAGHAQGNWLMFWNDDAVMKTKHWDREICAYDGQFYVLRMPTHREHPYAIFPILPRDWYELFGYVSPHQISDAWVSQMAFLLDIMRNISVEVEHDRHDLTGNNKDATFDQRVMLEGRPGDPKDFNHEGWRKRRLDDTARLASMLSERGQDMTWWENVKTGRQDAWVKMCSPEFDPNKQVSRMQYGR